MNIACMPDARFTNGWLRLSGFGSLSVTMAMMEVGFVDEIIALAEPVWLDGLLENAKE